MAGLAQGPVLQVVLGVRSDTALRADELTNSSIKSSPYIDWIRTQILWYRTFTTASLICASGFLERMDTPKLACLSW